MKHSFFAELSAFIEMDDTDFEYLKSKAATHYDFTVQGSIEVGGFLYGLTNRRAFSNGEDKTLELSGRQLQLCIKALEFDPAERSKTISSRLVSILKEMYSKSQEINKSLQ